MKNHTQQEPIYLSLSRQDLTDTIQEGLDRLRSCNLCPRECGVNRIEGETGFCQTGRNSHLASFHLHFGEEAPLVGNQGSGTIFFAGCNLGCHFCQNYDISHSTRDSLEVQPGQLAGVMLELQNKGALNINLVSPTHVLPQFLEALPQAVDSGLKLPIVYNCGGYERVDSLRLLDKVVDIYMPDIKFSDPQAARTYCQAEDYPEKARLALQEMHSQVGDLQQDATGLARRGLLVRHLLLPGGLAGSAAWFAFIAQEISTNTYLNVMDQYRPCGQARKHPELDRSISSREYEEALKLAGTYGLNRLDQRNLRRFQNLFRLL